MLITIADVLSADDLAVVRARLDGLAFGSGKATAGAAARSVKANEQVEQAASQGLCDFILAAINRNSVFAAAVRPARWGPVLLSRYQPGMAYGRHVDNAFMGGVRSDVSVTLFLDAPDSYEGGELALDLTGGTQLVKLPAEALVAYPSTAIHEVRPVTSGQRRAFVGWVESQVRGAEERELLFDLARARVLVAGSDAPADASLLLQKLEANLLRLLG
jgi:PKHD-type hydroxylase